MSSEERYFFNNIIKKIYYQKKYHKLKNQRYSLKLDNSLLKDIRIVIYLFLSAEKSASEEILLS